MFQLFDLIITSPIGAYLLNAVENTIYAALVVADCDDCGFKDLGKLLFGGLALAVVFGITISLLYRRSREENPGAEQFVSIRSRATKE
jgi:hypothetical protein